VICKTNFSTTKLVKLLDLILKEAKKHYNT
jgi:hypothetical protein